MRSSSFRFGWFSLAATALSLSACGGGHDELNKRLAAMQGDLTKLQSHSDRLEQRLEALEMRKDAPPPPLARTIMGDPSGSGDHPRLLVVKLEPGDDSREASTVSGEASPGAVRPEDSAADTTPRPVIRVYGSRTDVDPGTDSPKRKR